MSGRRRSSDDDLERLGRLRLGAVLGDIEIELVHARELAADGSSPRPALLKAREKLHALLTSIGVKMVALALMLVGSACEPCWAAPVHVQRCDEGDEASCVWLLDNLDATTGACKVPR